MSTKFEQVAQTLMFWQKDSSEAERLVGQLLFHEGYTRIEPMHPHGGRDSLKDLTFNYQDNQWIAAVYFPCESYKKSFIEVKKKFNTDIKGVSHHKARGIAFFTNCKLTLGNRSTLIEIARGINADAEIYHMERIAQMLNRPVAYGLRLDFLDIGMSQEEQVSFFDLVSSNLYQFSQRFTEQLAHMSTSLEQMHAREDKNDMVVSIERLKSTVASFFPSTAAQLAAVFLGARSGPSIDHLTLLVETLERLNNATATIGSRIEEMQQRLNTLMGQRSLLSAVQLMMSPPQKQVSLDEMIKKCITYEELLDRILEKQEQLGKNQDLRP